MMCMGEHGKVIKCSQFRPPSLPKASSRSNLRILPCTGRHRSRRTATLAGAALYLEDEDRLYPRAPQQGSGDWLLESGRK